MITIGKIIGDKYMIESFVGSGGMAQVYRAHDINTGQVVAVKILKDEFQNDAEFVRRFEREARAGLTLSHDNIVHSLDVGEDDGLHFIVFEYINGRTLKEYIKENGALTPKAAVNFASQILNALTLAHERGIIHRDVKPQNVMITGQGVAKLADFGIARDSAASTKTFTGSDVLGSVHYISPEQARGEEVTQQSDLYSVAIILYEMLTGSVPFDSENSVSVALKHLSEDIQPPIELNDKISPALNDVILKAAQKDTALRYATASEMKEDLIKSLSDPNGSFAKGVIVSKRHSEQDSQKSKSEHYPNEVTGQKNAQENPSGLKKLNRGVLRIMIALGAIIAVCLIAFVAVTLNYNSTHIYVPDLLGRTYEEAIALAGDDFEVIITDRASSDEYPMSGRVIRQDPVSGTRANSGAAIKVTISIDSDYVIVPKLTDMTLLEANNAISKAGLVLGEVRYNSDSQATAGRVYEQSPDVDLEARRGSQVILYISGVAPDSAYMPNVTSKDIDTAVSTLNNFGFNHVLIKYVNTEDESVVGTVFDQSINPGVELDKEMMIIISVYGELTGPYSADRAYNVSVEQNDTPVMATIVTNQGYEVIVFESMMSSGTQTASFTVRIDEEGTYTCILYVNNVEDRREDIRFSYND